MLISMQVSVLNIRASLSANRSVPPDYALAVRRYHAKRHVLSLFPSLVLTVFLRQRSDEQASLTIKISHLAQLINICDHKNENNLYFF